MCVCGGGGGERSLCMWRLLLCFCLFIVLCCVCFGGSFMGWKDLNEQQCSFHLNKS